MDISSSYTEPGYALYDIKYVESLKAQAESRLDAFKRLSAENEQWRGDWLNMQAENEQFEAAIQNTWKPEVKALRARIFQLEAENERLKAKLEKLTVHREPRDYFDSEAADNA